MINQNTNEQGGIMNGRKKVKDKIINRTGAAKRKLAAHLLGTAITMAAIIAAGTGALVLKAEAATPYLPNVTSEMSNPTYWSNLSTGADTLLADSVAIQKMNQAVAAKDDCYVYDLEKTKGTLDGVTLSNNLYEAGLKELSGFIGSGYWNAVGDPISGEWVNQISLNCINPAAANPQNISYAIAVARTDMKAYPTPDICTDQLGDNDFDYLQLTDIRVGEPLIVRSVSADGLWYYCRSICCDGWIRVADVALCRNKQEWVNSWKMSGNEMLVITTGRIYLPKSNTSPDISEKMLTMGTTLRLVPDSGQNGLITNRSSVNNFAVYVPTRGSDGYLVTKTALIPEHYAGYVSIGYLPLTQANIARVALSMLGENYGWGGMLGSSDCSGYIRNIYKCFGLELPRNTKRQAAMPAFRINVDTADDLTTQVWLDQLPLGTICIFSAHEMLYLGSVNGRHYVISNFSSMRDLSGTGTARIRSVTINTLEDIYRANGKSWLTATQWLVVPWVAES